MGRKIGAVIGGYIVMFLTVFITFTITYLLLGAEGSFEPGTYEVTTIWLLASIILSFIAAVVGGIVCVAIGKEKKTANYLAIFVLVLGLLFAIPELTSEDTRPTVRDGSVDNMTAMTYARQPIWLTLLNPLIGVAGVFVGAGLKDNKEEESA
ncbi:MAG: hypothetical protein K9J12_14225 [Melioribacteraceae bacterium]|nr:hypothetical protein [Melioribacteraceae bacterium]MCF8264142.1 hypothetical protein [Melioribacteraceae bacterium]MCF8413799.1 hypothetical protein [Melioribacteraceae bacterium]MCF8430766.1 hypothetical protein [Melioribacteraceae bacterium]